MSSVPLAVRGETRSVISWLLRAILSLVALASCTAAIAEDELSAREFDPAMRTSSWVKGPPIAIEHVNVLPMTEGAGVMRDMTVVLRDGRIAEIFPTKEGKRPTDARCIDGKGRWLMPAFADMHVHVENDRALRLFTGNPDIQNGAVADQDVLLPYFANGVFQIFNLFGMAESQAQRKGVESGQVLGPHMALAAMADGDPPIWPSGFTHVTATPSDGRQFVRDMKAEGFDHIKTYSNLDLATFEAILDEARINGMRVVGHLPGRRTDNTEAYLKPGFDLVAHAEEFAYQAASIEAASREIPRYVALAKANGTWLISTLTLDERIAEQMAGDSWKHRDELRYVHPITRDLWLNMNPYSNSEPGRVAMVDAVVHFNRKLVKAFADAGIVVLPGTDSMVPGVVPGYSLHDEFESLARAGLSNEQILTAATLRAAEWLGVDSDRGTVEVGKRADLVLLKKNPLADISATRTIAAVISSGRYFSREVLDERMNDLAERYATTPIDLLKGEPKASFHDDH